MGYITIDKGSTVPMSSVAAFYHMTLEEFMSIDWIDRRMMIQEYYCMEYIFAYMYPYC